MATFLEVFLGKADKLRIAIAVGSTRAKREDINVAIWELPRDKLLLIMEDIAKQERVIDIARAAKQGQKKPPVVSAEQMAIRCDIVGIENRFFRMNQMVADWIDNTEPAETVDYAIL